MIGTREIEGLPSVTLPPPIIPSTNLTPNVQDHPQENNSINYSNQLGQNAELATFEQTNHYGTDVLNHANDSSFNIPRIMPNVKLKIKSLAMFITTIAIIGQMMNLSLPMIANETITHLDSMSPTVTNEIPVSNVGYVFITTTVYLSSIAAVYTNVCLSLAYDIITKKVKFKEIFSRNIYSHELNVTSPPPASISNVNLNIITSSVSVQTMDINISRSAIINAINILPSTTKPNELNTITSSTKIKDHAIKLLEHFSVKFISTAIRIMPSSNGQISSIYRISKNAIEIGDEANGNHYPVDRVFPQIITTDEIHEYFSSMTEFTAKNDTMVFFAIGGTGTGKTFTLCGAENTNDIGLIGRTISGYVSNHINSLRVKVSAFEIAAKSVVDLCAFKTVGFSPQTFNINLVSTHELSSLKDVRAFITMLRNKRTIKATRHNSRSSRAHLVVKISVDQHNLASLHENIIFVDLAGFEPADEHDCASSSFINSTLLTLQNVLRAIANNSSRIPFRESLLTRILKPFLLLRCKIFVMGTVALKTINARMDSTTLKFVSSITGRKLKIDV